MIHQIVIHCVITILAVAIAFSLPEAARYVLFQWWPQVENNAQLLLYSELVLAATLVALFHLVRFACRGHRVLKISRVASLIEVREGGKQTALLGDFKLNNGVSVTRDAFVLAVTGYDTFVAADSHLGRIIGNCYEIRVLLLSPHSAGAAQRANAFTDPQRALAAHREELTASIQYLRQLSACGKRISLKLYEAPPFWKIVIVGDHAWIQYCHAGYEVRTQPEFVFALRRDRPEQGFFPPFYMHLLNLWNDPRNAQYDFATDQLVFRDSSGNEMRRVAYPSMQSHAASARGSMPPAHCTLPA